jgi:hypothetical protein
MSTFLLQRWLRLAPAIVFVLACAMTAPAAVHAQSCITQTSGDGWIDEPFDIAQNGTFTATFDATPSVSPITGSGHVGISLGSQNAYTGFANIVRFNSTGTIDARNGGAYAASTTIAYSGGVTYHVRLVINVPAHTYSIFVTPAGSTERTLGSNFAFRTEQNTVNGLDWYGVFVPDGSTDSLSVCNFATTVPATTCMTATSNGVFQNQSFPTQTTQFTAEFDATPSVSGINSIVGLSSGAPAAFTGYAAISRFNPAGVIDARNGGAYQADVTFPFTGGSTYHFRLFVDVPNHVYSVSVTPPGGSETLLTNTPFAFRTEQAGVANLNNWGVQVNTTTPGSTTVCGFIIRPGGILPALR